MKVSIIVIDYNYGRFVGVAIESALAQTWPDTEVIVVDDGSTDESPEVIARYAGRVKALRKENGGQASAFQLGFEHSTGQLVILLDADDILYPHCVERVVAHYRTGVSKIQHCLDTIDGAGHNLNLPFPHYSAELTPAEIRRRSLASGVYTWPVAAGNSFDRDFLRRVLPIPDLFKNIADGYLSKLAPLYGDVETIPAILAAYRVHGGNFWAQASITGGKYAQATRYELDMAEAFVAKAKEQGYAVDKRRLLLNKLHLEARLLSWRLAPQRHPVHDEKMVRLVWLGLRSAWVAPDVGLVGRLFWSLWFIAIGFLPVPAVAYLAGQFRRQDFRSPIARLLVGLSRRGSRPESGTVSTLVSIIITNHNYGHFLRESVNSALDQSWKNLEVIVVDDGSTDVSRAVIESFGSRIHPIFQPTGGQTSAFNAGFAMSRGEVVIFLDGDDRLRPHCVATVMAVWRSDIAKVQYRLATIDANGRDLRLPFPRYSRRLRRDLTEARRQLLKVGSYAWPGASGNAFTRNYLLKVMPLPVEFRRAPDGLLNRLIPLHGPVNTLSGILADYRVHSANVLAQQDLEPEKYAANVKYEIEREQFFHAHASTLGYELPKNILVRNKKHLETRLLSLRLCPQMHPLPKDRSRRLAWLGVKSAFYALDITLLGRLIWMFWFLSLAILPRRTVAFLVWRTRLQSRRNAVARSIIRLAKSW